jgi:hypothetical protein
MLSGRSPPHLGHDPEKWEPVFRKDHAEAKSQSGDDDSKKSYPAPAAGAQRGGSNEAVTSLLTARRKPWNEWRHPQLSE